ncbi:hypothetical protein G7Y89_g3764 [Cudoniella acicularis]|uniref:Uncharacterized protein n=1 Tax=Cudoniella acicularis TaxID=354080 RepID=A0A8H4RSV2_9HELO|nr:hypothetical protein G7Y89_g3764 [Cudoniella acicularis]
MLFKAWAFKSPSVDSPERFYSLDVLDGLNKQQLPLKEKLNEGFVFYETVREAHGVYIAHELKLSSNSPYTLRDGAAKGLNESHLPRHKAREGVDKVYVFDNPVDRPPSAVEVNATAICVGQVPSIIYRFKKEQLVIDSERQLSGKVVDEDMRGVLERSDQITPEQPLLIDAILTLPKTSLEKELPVGGGVHTIVKAKEQARSELNVALSHVISSVMPDKRPTKCFLCLRNPQLSIRERIRDYATPGSLSRHFHSRHVKKLLAKQVVTNSPRWPGLEIDRIVREVTTSPMVTDDKGYVNIVELCQLVGLVNQEINAYKSKNNLEDSTHTSNTGKSTKERLEQKFPKYRKSGLGGKFREVENRKCVLDTDLRLAHFRRQGNGPPIAFEERKTGRANRK